ncbi:MAG: hypothetical protein WA049_07950 [Ferribacterium limneticum]
MDATATTQSVPAQSRGILGTVKIVTTLSVIAGLLTTNVATLTNDAAHTSIFDGLKQAMSYAFTDNLANRLLNHSPNEARKSDVARRTTILETEKDILRRRSITLEQEKVALVQQKQKISTEHDDLKSKHQKLATEQTELSNKHSKLTNDHAELNRSHNKLTADHNDLTTKHNKIVQTQEKQAATARKVSARIAPRIMHTATRSVSSLPARVAPLAGAALTVGMTLWEINDMCETLKDMNELNSAFGHTQIDANTVCGIRIPGT